MWIIILPLILLKLLIRTTLTSPTLLLSITKQTISLTTTIKRKYSHLTASLFWDILNWIFYVLAPIIWILIICGSEIVQGELYMPKYAWELFWHEDGRSLLRMLSDPEGC